MSTSTSAARCSSVSVARAASTSARRSLASATSESPSLGEGAEPVLVFGQRLGRVRATAPHPVEAGVNDDSVHPGRHLCVAPEAAGPPKRRDQRLLQRVGRVFGIAGRAQSHRPEPVTMPADDLAECVWVAVDVGRQQVASSRWS